MDGKSPQQVAAEMLAGPRAWENQLHFKLHDAIDRADYWLRPEGLQSREVIAAIIVAWELANPDKEAYCNE